MTYDTNDEMFYDEYYSNQAGNGMGYFAGRSYMPQQSGDGIGNFLKSAGKFLTPILSRGARTVGKNLLSSGVGIVGDLMEGKKFKDVAKSRLKETGKNVMGSLISEFTGRGDDNEEEQYDETDETPLIAPKSSRKRKNISQRKKGGKRRKNIFL